MIGWAKSQKWGGNLVDWGAFAPPLLTLIYALHFAAILKKGAKKGVGGGKNSHPPDPFRSTPDESI